MDRYSSAMIYYDEPGMKISADGEYIKISDLLEKIEELFDKTAGYDHPKAIWLRELYQELLRERL